MSSKRIWWLTAFGAAVLVCVVVVVTLISYYKNDSSEMILPETTPVAQASEKPNINPGMERVSVTPLNVQSVIGKTLTRPDEYKRDIVIESFWEGGSAVYNITAVVSGEITSLRVLSVSGGFDKRIIVTGEKLYVWYQGDETAFESDLLSNGEGIWTADEWQMILTYEDIMEIDVKDIIEAGYTLYDNERCIYFVYKSPLLNYMTRCFVSLEHGLLIGAEEYDGQTPVSVMSSGRCEIGETDEEAFVLPGGVNVLN